MKKAPPGEKEDGMGDIADMMLDGTLCEQCGEFIDDDEGGSPRLCASCSQEKEKPVDVFPKRKPGKPKKGKANLR